MTFLSQWHADPTYVIDSDISRIVKNYDDIWEIISLDLFRIDIDLDLVWIYF
jgi:hypothetical protein